MSYFLERNIAMYCEISTHRPLVTVVIHRMGQFVGSDQYYYFLHGESVTLGVKTLSGSQLQNPFS